MMLLKDTSELGTRLRKCPSLCLFRSLLVTNLTPNKELVYWHGVMIANIFVLATIACQVFSGYGNIRYLELAAILVQKDPIRAAVWDPTCTRLVVCTGSSHLYMWTPGGAYCVSIPLPQFSILDLKWNSDGSCLLLKDKESFCCGCRCVLPEESSEYSSDD
ncbi:hypothetical protein M0R45_037774 [Rubus argutus]|uniref:Uncharacterized protein n=1 Tax=Rubus argutus TaxID=59490 RepID=A0AAW1W5E4_RUBAR